MAADEQLLAEPAKRARADAVSLGGEDRLLQRATKIVVAAAMEGERDDHLGQAKHHPSGRDDGDPRNGVRTKTVLNECPGRDRGAAKPGREVRESLEPHRARPPTLVQPMEGGTERVRHHLRRPPDRRSQVEQGDTNEGPRDLLQRRLDRPGVVSPDSGREAVAELAAVLRGLSRVAGLGCGDVVSTGGT